MRLATTTAQRATTGTVRTSYRRSLIVATVLAMLMRFGAFWDAQWHWSVGRDSFFIPPHLMIYTGTALIGLLSLVMAWNSSVRRGRMSAIFWSWITQLLGVALMVSAAPFDDLWHRLYGLDVTIWSPPHLVGIVGAWIIDLGIFVGWAIEWQQDVEPQHTRTSMGGLIWATAIIVSMLNFALVPAVRWSVVQPAAPILYMVLGSLLIPGIMITLGWLTGRMWPIVVVVGTLIVFRLLDQQLWNFGLRTVVPLWDQTVSRTDSTWFNWHFWLHVILNSVTALTVFSLTGSWRIRRRVWGAAFTGLLAGFMTYCAVGAFASGLVTQTLPFVDEGAVGQEFHAESDLLVAFFSRSGIAPWGWALLSGALSGIGGYVLVRAIRRAGRTQRADAAFIAPRREQAPTRRTSPAHRTTNAHVD